MRYLLAIVFAILFVVPLQATTLEILTGRITTFPAIPPDSFYNFGGDGFSVMGTAFGRGYIGGSGFSILFSDSMGSIPTSISVDGFTPCVPQNYPHVCGEISFAIDPFAPVIDPDPATYLSTAHFTANGHINVGDNCFATPFSPPSCQGFDIAGEGFVTMRYNNNLGYGYQPNPTFAFTVPELSSLALLPLGLIGIVVAGSRRKRMDER